MPYRIVLMSVHVAGIEVDGLLKQRLRDKHYHCFV